jgi:uncharacterized protein with FMN-binding domain
VVTANLAARGRRNAAVFAGSVAVVGLLMLYPTSTDKSTAHRTPGQPLAPVGVVSGPPATPKSSRSTTSPAPSPSANPAVVVVNGSSIGTPYGPIQIQVTIQAQRITKTTVLDYPQDGGRSQEINDQALPVLGSETLSAQSAKIDTVSGATYTSDGYRQSLQAALDAAHFNGSTS